MPVSRRCGFAVIDREIYTRTLASSKKIARARRDNRATFLVEAGLRWAELLG